VPYALRRPRLYYERRGAGEPLLLITGFTISSAVFDPVLDLYAGAFECITYDNRGSGRSGAPLHPTSMAELAADAARLLDALEIDSAHVYGLSMGGMVAQELALRFPERVRGLILGGTTPGGPRAVRPALSELGALAAASAGALHEEGRPWLGAWLFSPEFRRDQPERVRELLRHFDRHRAPAHGALVGDRLPRHGLAPGTHPGADARPARRARRDGPGGQRAPARRAHPRRAARARRGGGTRVPARTPGGGLHGARRVAGGPLADPGGPAEPRHRRTRRAAHARARPPDRGPADRREPAGRRNRTRATRRSGASRPRRTRCGD